MTYKLKPDTPRPLSRCGAYVAPGRDARWRDPSQDDKPTNTYPRGNK